MKKRRRIQTAFNAIALGVLFFALYLNFLHKENTTEVPASRTTTSQQTILIQNPDQYLKKEHAKYNDGVSATNLYN